MLSLLNAQHLSVYAVSCTVGQMFNFIDIYSFIPASACVGKGPTALLCLWAYNAVKTALLTGIASLLGNMKS
jgi:hypothetical protein